MLQCNMNSYMGRPRGSVKRLFAMQQKSSPPVADRAAGVSTGRILWTASRRPPRLEKLWLLDWSHFRTANRRPLRLEML